MSSLNSVSIIGHVGKDPEVRYTADGTGVASFSVACGEKWKDGSGSLKEHTEWFNVTAWGKLADIVKQYVAKGRQIFVSGRMRTETWTDKDGVERRTPKVRAEKIVLLGKAPQNDEFREPGEDNFPPD